MSDGNSRGSGRNRDPQSVSDVLGAVGRDLGADDPRKIGAISDSWSEILGEELSEHVQFVSLREGVLVLGATQPEWASRARFEGARIAQEVNARNGEGSVLDVKVRVLRIDPRAH